MLLGAGAALHFDGSGLPNHGARKSYDYWFCHAVLLSPILVTRLQLSLWQVKCPSTIIHELSHSLPQLDGLMGIQKCKAERGMGDSAELSDTQLAVLKS